MKFDPAHVVASVAELSDPRFSGSAGLAPLAEWFTERLAEAGWTIDRGELREFEPAGSIVVGHRATETPAGLRVLIRAPLGRAVPDRRPSPVGRLFRGWAGQAPTEDSPVPPTPADLSGLATLLELARAWPDSWSRRLEPVLVATDASSETDADWGAIMRRLDPGRAEIPTLILTLIGPGIGRELIVAGDRQQELALACARSLWIPIAGAKSASWLRRLLPTPSDEGLADRVALIGSGLEAPESLPLDSDALRRAAQLVAEIALRWAKEPRGNPGGAGGSPALR